MIDPHLSGPTGARGWCPPGSSGRIYGGALLAQMVKAAAPLAHSDSRVNALHSHFLRSGLAEHPVDYGMELLQASRRFSTVRVDARQDGRLIATSTVSFHSPENSPAHSVHMAAEWSEPEGSEPAEDRRVPLLTAGIRAPWELRWAARLDSPGQAERPSVALWIRLRESAGEAASSHEAALAWASDFTLTKVADIDYEHSSGPRQAASLDHAMWFHRPFRANDWLLHVQDSPAYEQALALTTGRVFDRSGNLIASVMQESLLRRLPLGSGEDVTDLTPTGG
ncbi:acyl-CoA thioesterase II [Cryobacterium sp. TMS1-20-1]|uniref:acyl-CoA thioesterase n=1 Tax=Cryobacterium sp. TMS1-20-1 TaxID=1259223 RepID=UPI002107182B|nr:acyl-CoA thioesterase domain-containing protein [Cryobacterium sp. TMS1-20-1]